MNLIYLERIIRIALQFKVCVVVCSKETDETPQIVPEQNVQQSRSVENEYVSWNEKDLIEIEIYQYSKSEETIIRKDSKLL